LKIKKLEEIVTELLSRPGHTKVTTLLYSLLTDGLGADSKLIDFERRVPEVRGASMPCSAALCLKSNPI